MTGFIVGFLLGGLVGVFLMACIKIGKTAELEMEVALLERKQIPKKPKVLKVHDISGYKYGDCHCGEHIMDDEKFCSNCGQKLDWSDTDENTRPN